MWMCSPTTPGGCAGQRAIASAAAFFIHGSVRSCRALTSAATASALFDPRSFSSGIAASGLILGSLPSTALRAAFKVTP